ncbi:hypothetical protein [Streptomyces phaeochromogenes]|uniref:hypothetical protein n=1 Tax=Streptomyces phaeochromogenes TaxID=1923 RepID=UPI002DDB194E|nr:hypothetical protein [Streptomyces phaeochromogenes]WRZ31354.1 hypothetical protein OG931_28220 [Streptomyces phaeochromogenes]
MKRDPLLWAALAAVLVVLASAEYQLAVACGFGTYVAAGVPAALDVYALAALRARRDVFTVVVTLIAVNAASHLVEVGLLPVSVGLVVAVSAVAPLVLWRVHRLSEGTPTGEDSSDAASAELAPEPVPVMAEPAEPITLERAEPASGIPDTPADTVPVLGPFTPLAELARGTSGTGRDLLGDHFSDAAKLVGGTRAEPAPEPVPVSGTDSGTGAADIESSDSQNTTFEARVALVRTWLATEPDLTGTEIGTRFRVSDGYGRRVLRTARDDS